MGRPNLSKADIIRGDLIDFANEASKIGVRLNNVKFQFNVHGECTQALLNYDELPDYNSIEPLDFSAL